MITGIYDDLPEHPTYIQLFTYTASCYVIISCLLQIKDNTFISHLLNLSALFYSAMVVCQQSTYHLIPTYSNYCCPQSWLGNSNIFDFKYLPALNAKMSLLWLNCVIILIHNYYIKCVMPQRQNLTNDGKCCSLKGSYYRQFNTGYSVLS